MIENSSITFTTPLFNRCIPLPFLVHEIYVNFMHTTSPDNCKAERRLFKKMKPLVINQDINENSIVKEMKKKYQFT